MAIGQPNGCGARKSPGSSIASDCVESCSYTFGGMEGGSNPHNDGGEGGAAGRGGASGGGGGGGVYSRGPSLDIEVDVRKRVLELVS